MTNLPVPTWSTVTPGTFDTSAMFNTVSNNGNFLTNPPLFAGYQSAAQSIPNASSAAVGIDSTIVDTYGAHSNVTNNNRYTPNVAGWFLCLGSVGFAVSAANSRDLEFRKNGSTVNLGQALMLSADSTVNPVVKGWAVIQCNGTTDYIDMTAFQDSGGALNTYPGQTGMAVFWIHA